MRIPPHSHHQHNLNYHRHGQSSHHGGYGGGFSGGFSGGSIGGFSGAGYDGGFSGAGYDGGGNKNVYMEAGGGAALLIIGIILLCVFEFTSYNYTGFLACGIIGIIIGAVFVSSGILSYYQNKNSKL